MWIEWYTGCRRILRPRTVKQEQIKKNYLVRTKSEHFWNFFLAKLFLNAKDKFGLRRLDVRKQMGGRRVEINSPQKENDYPCQYSWTLHGRRGQHAFRKSRRNRLLMFDNWVLDEKWETYDDDEWIRQIISSVWLFNFEWTNYSL